MEHQSDILGPPRKNGQIEVRHDSALNRRELIELGKRLPGAFIVLIGQTTLRLALIRCRPMYIPSPNDASRVCHMRLFLPLLQVQTLGKVF